MVDKLTDEQIAEYKDAFRLFDTSKDGWIPTYNLGNLLRSVGHNPTESELQDMIRKTDKRAKGKFDFPEFLTLIVLRKSNKQDTEQEIRRAFGVYMDDQGYISENRLRDLLTNMGDQLTDEEMQDLIRDLRPDHNGRVKFEDVIHVLMSAS